MDIRPILTQEELNEARTLLSADALEPEWTNAFVLIENGRVNGLFCPTIRLIGTTLILEIEPLHVRYIGASSIALIFWADAHMRAIAAANGLKGYTYVTANPAFQRLSERYLPVTWQNDPHGRRYFRIFS